MHEKSEIRYPSEEQLNFIKALGVRFNLYIDFDGTLTGSAGAVTEQTTYYREIMTNLYSEKEHPVLSVVEAAHSIGDYGVDTILVSENALAFLKYCLSLDCCDVMIVSLNHEVYIKALLEYQGIETQKLHIVQASKERPKGYIVREDFLSDEGKKLHAYTINFAIDDDAENSYNMGMSIERFREETSDLGDEKTFYIQKKDPYDSGESGEDVTYPVKILNITSMTFKPGTCDWKALLVEIQSIVNQFFPMLYACNALQDLNNAKDPNYIISVGRLYTHYKSILTNKSREQLEKGCDEEQEDHSCEQLEDAKGKGKEPVEDVSVLSLMSNSIFTQAGFSKDAPPDEDKEGFLAGIQN